MDFDGFVLQADKPELLTEEEKATKLTAVLKKGWSVVEERDAIRKKFTFDDFNAVRPITGLQFPALVLFISPVVLNV